MPFAACRYVMTEAIVDLCPGGLSLFVVVGSFGGISDFS